MQDLKKSTMGVCCESCSTIARRLLRFANLLKDRAEKFLTELEAIVFQARAKVDGTPRN
jgi:hypothetical protein